MGKTKRILSAVLAVGMLTMTTSASVFAVDTNMGNFPTGGVTAESASGNAYSINMLAETVYEHNIADGSIEITETGYSVGGGAEIPYTGDYLIYGDSSELKNSSIITVKSGTHNITIKDLNIVHDSVSQFDIQPNANVNLTLEGTSILVNGASQYAPLHVPENATLTITEESTGRLEVYGGIGAGIGGNRRYKAGNIVINGGTIIVDSDFGAGIGGGGQQEEAGGTIIINGGNVTATSDWGAGIGGGWGFVGDTTVIITGGNVTATSDWGAGIGCGRSATDHGTFSTTDINGVKGNAVIFASSTNGEAIGDRSDETNWSGAIFENTDGKVYGDNVKPTEDFTIPVGYTLTIPRCLMLDISEITVTNEGTINTHCKDTNEYEGTGTVNRPHKIELAEAVEPTCTTDGNSEYWACEDCGTLFDDGNGTTELEEIPIIEKLGHDFGTEWIYDEANHWHECACGEKSDIAPHTEDGGTIVKEATVDSEGEKVFKCTVCGRVLRTEVIDKLPEETEAPTTTPSGVVVTYIITENVTLGAGVEEEASRSSGIIPIAVSAVICVGAAVVSKKKKEE